MLSIPNNVRIRFNDTTKEAQVILREVDYKYIIKSVCKTTGIPKKNAKMYLEFALFTEIKRVYGEPDQVHIIMTK